MRIMPRVVRKMLNGSAKDWGDLRDERIDSASEVARKTFKRFVQEGIVELLLRVSDWHLVLVLQPREQ
jgi:hypothetical protein